MAVRSIGDIWKKNLWQEKRIFGVLFFIVMAKLVTEQLKSGQFDYRNKNEIQIH